MPDFAIETDGLTKVFGGKTAVDALTLRVPTGSVFALLGRSGSGKTTTIRMLLGLLRPTSGSSRVLGHDSRSLTPAIRGRIGYMPETHPLHAWMTVTQEGWFASQFNDGWDHRVFASVLSQFRIARDARVQDLSGGERAGLSLAIALAPRPDVLILDNLGAGLDPVSRNALIDMTIEVIHESGPTVMLSSHLLNDVAHLADVVAVLDYSRLRISGSIDAITASVMEYRLTFAPGAMPAQIPAIAGLLSTRRTDDSLFIMVETAQTPRLARDDIPGVIAIEGAPVPFDEAATAYMGLASGRSVTLTGTAR